MNIKNQLEVDSLTIGNFFSLDISQVLEAVEGALGEKNEAPTGLCYALNSLENRVYEIELENEASGQKRRVVAKFYHPGRWSRDTILDEHKLLLALQEAEIPVCAPLLLRDGAEPTSLSQTKTGIYFSVFPRIGGRAVEELDLAGYEQLGRLLGRIHTVAAGLELHHRPVLSPESYGQKCLDAIIAKGDLALATQSRYSDVVQELIVEAQKRWPQEAGFVVHADCHRGNLLSGRDGWFFLDFDDAAVAPPVQDLWLLLPARVQDCPQELEAMLKGYESFRPFDRQSLQVIEALRALRYVRYAAWVATRWEDPSFKKAFPQWGTDNYWQGQLIDLYEQMAILKNPGAQFDS